MIEQITQNGITVNQCQGSGWRLVHDGNSVLNLFYVESGITQTINNLFVGTEEECRAEIMRLGLTQTNEVT